MQARAQPSSYLLLSFSGVVVVDGKLRTTDWGWSKVREPPASGSNIEFSLWDARYKWSKKNHAFVNRGDGEGRSYYATLLPYYLSRYLRLEEGGINLQRVWLLSYASARRSNYLLQRGKGYKRSTLKQKVCFLCDMMLLVVRNKKRMH